VEDSAIGRQLRARRTAAGRTVASVAADAGLSVPYIANLENGRGNPTTAALARLAEALGLRLVVALVPDEESQSAGAAAAGVAGAASSAGVAGGVASAGVAGLAGGSPVPEIPASLVRLGRTIRFRQAVTAMAGALDLDAGEFSAHLVAALAALAQATGKDLAEPDWWRLLDALLLIATHPASS
jgi:Helix-turn-helix domain